MLGVYLRMMLDPRVISDLEAQAKEIRRDIIEMVYRANSGHPGPALSMTDIVTALYFHVLRIDPANPHWPDRDRVIISKGHACPAVYAALARKGFFPREWLWTFRHLGTKLQGHPDMRKTPGIDMTSGSLGHGLSAGIGMALAAKLDRREYTVYVILGDGECQEGIVWEAALTAPNRDLDNLIAIVDYNHFQSGGSVEQIMPMEPFKQKWEAFGWRCFEMDGHNMKGIIETLAEAKACDRPALVIAHTVKGKGVSFMENDNLWHMHVPSKEQYEQAMAELA